MSPPNPSSRRDFLKSVAATTAIGAIPLGGNVFALTPPEPPQRPVAPNDRIRFATIGMGIIGFIDTETALRIPGAEFVAAADLYEGRRIRTQEVHGQGVEVTNDYRELLDRDDIDAVLICTPDHWHTKMAVDAMRAGKAVYCEKPMVRTVAEGPEILKVQRETNAVFQVGSQYSSSILYNKVKELIAEGAIGQLNAVEARYNRNSSIGAWQYSIPTDASPETVDWDRFLGDAPKRPFDPVRFFRWRNYWDYGTAVAGDLYVHLFTGIHHVLDALGPNKVASMGGLRYWDDGRDVYDVIMSLFDYPKTENHPAFTLALQTNFVDGGGGGMAFRFAGTDGELQLGYTDLTLNRVGMHQHTADEVLKGYNSVRTFSEAQQKAFAEQFHAEQAAAREQPQPQREWLARFVVPRGYDERLDHFELFFRSIREGTPVYQDSVFGYRAAAPALLANDSYREGKIYHWDPEAMQVTT